MNFLPIFLSIFMVINFSTTSASSNEQIKGSECSKKNNILEAINAIIFSKENDALKYYSNQEIKKRLSHLIYSYLQDEDKFQICLNKIKNLYEEEDFRWVAIYLKSLRSNDKIFETMFYNENYNKEDMFLYYFLKDNKKNPKNVVFVDSMSNIFQNLHNIIAYIPDNSNQGLFLDLLHSTKNQLSDYIDKNFDLAGRCSLVRKGLVKKLLCKNHIIISKRNNSAKKGRFVKEQENIEKLKNILGIPKQTDWLLIKDEQGRSIKLKLLSPFAIFSAGDSSKFYSLTFFQSGKPLEELILDERDVIKRKNYLKDMRLLLDFLYQKGIIWGDMSPRNILVEEINDDIFYTILDFEKTIILDRPVSMYEREEHARGPMCVEEFGAICTEEEVTEAFSPYFNPAEWDVFSKEKIPFINPKEEIISLLKERGIAEPTFGEYNKIEKEIMQIRFFQNFSKYENYSSLISVGFRIYHYLGDVYDMKTTEILLHAQKHEMMLSVINLLEKFLEAFENKLILKDFEDIVHGDLPSIEQKQNMELDLVARAIDALYREKDSASRMSIVLNEFENILNSYYISLDSKFEIEKENLKNP